MEELLSPAAQVFSLPQPDGLRADFRDYHERVGRALVQVLALSHRLCLETWSPAPPEQPSSDPLPEYPLASAEDLRRIRSAVLNAQDDACNDLAKVGSGAGDVWAWYRYLIADESDTVTRPHDVPADCPGRWVKQLLPIGADCGSVRYLAHVDYLSTRVGTKQLWTRCRGKTPALFISWVGDEVEEWGQTKAQHRVVLNYQLRVISANWHGGVQARFESPLEIERRSDPGAHRIIGDIRRVLTMGYQLQNTDGRTPPARPWRKCLGIETIKLGGSREIAQFDAERWTVFETTVRVIGYVETSNTPCEILDPFQMWVELQDAQGNPAAAMQPFQV